MPTITPRTAALLAKAVVIAAMVAVMLPCVRRSEANIRLRTPVNLIHNGDFSRQLERWERFHDGTVSDREWSAKVVVDESTGSEVFEWKTVTGGRDGNTTGVRQQLDMDPSEYRELILEADVKVIGHSLWGGGKGLGGEYPAELVLQYENGRGERKALRAFFYAVGPEVGRHQPQFHLEQIPPGAWHHYRSTNLVPELGDAERLNFLQLSGSGWDYHARIDNVALWALPASKRWRQTDRDRR